MRLPPNSLDYFIDFRINLRNIFEFMEKRKVYPFRPEEYKKIAIVYNHRSPTLFRKEYQFNYENTVNFSADNNPQSGWISHLTDEGEVVAKLSSKKTSIRLTSLAMRFKPYDFSNMKLRFKVTNNVENADVLLGEVGEMIRPFKCGSLFELMTKKLFEKNFL